MDIFTFLPIVILGGIVWIALRMSRRRARLAEAMAGLNQYYALVSDAHDSGEVALDWQALRAACAASPDYHGRARFNERAPVAGESEAELSMLLLLRDFPMLPTQMEAAEYFSDHPEEFGPEMGALCHARFHDLASFIEASARDSDQGRIHEALCIDEEYAFLMWMGATPSVQNLIHIDGRPHDLFETDKGPVIFDISSFYELQAELALMGMGPGAQPGRQM